MNIPEGTYDIGEGYFIFSNHKGILSPFDLLYTTMTGL